MRRPALRSLLAPLVTTLVAGLLVAGPAPSAQARGNVVTPGDFRGFGFDQCLAPEQWKMDRWLETSPFLAVGIYISGDSRGCRNQPNLTPAWVSTQLAKGWRLLPITLGPQASCQPRYPRYSDDVTISPKPGANKRYFKAKSMGRAEAAKSVGVARGLGITAGSTLWYDLEGFDTGNAACRESALSFLSGWTSRLHELGYVSGVYSSAGSGIKALDDARVGRPTRFVLPDRVWMARWDGVANTSTSYVREQGWRPGNRVKQYQGGHNETWGGVTINIDRNYLDLGNPAVAAESHCGGVQVNFWEYQVLRPAGGGYRPARAKVKALQCLLREQGAYRGRINGWYNPRLQQAVRTWRGQHGFPVSNRFSPIQWVALHASGARPVVKTGSKGPAVRRLQRALNAARPSTHLRVTGLVDGATVAAVKAYQGRRKQSPSGIANTAVWNQLAAGKR